METIELFIQGEGHKDIVVLEVSQSTTAAELVRLAIRAGAVAQGAEDEARLWLENEDEPLEREVVLVEAEIIHGSHVHLHRCHRIEVTIRYNGTSHNRHFAPSSTLAKVHRWAVSHNAFNLSEIDAAEHALQVCGSADRPDSGAHLGTLVSGKCEVCFDLVPKRRVEG